jgi:5-methylthioadenosine/S-adenosylhomocysteine deaminase
VEIKKWSEQLELPIHIHLHETLHEVESAVAHNGITPLQRLQDMGLVNASLIAVHMTQLSAAEIEQLAKAGAHIVHCPESNLKLASGFSPVAQCLAAGINVALGTDGAASNNDLDMFGEMRTAALLAKAVSKDATAVSATVALQMATINGAKALGLDEVCGSLRIGKAADVIAIDLSYLETQPLYCPVSQIVYAASRHQVSDVWVTGQRLLKQRQLTTIDKAALLVKVAKWQERLAS